METLFKDIPVKKLTAEELQGMNLTEADRAKLQEWLKEEE